MIEAAERLVAIGAERWNDGPGGADGWWVVFPIAWFLVVVGAITAVVIFARRRGQQAGQQAGERRLAERYAAGEIDEQEYQRRLEMLKNLAS
ncbi:MAG: SHOCT domain-containing protein [Jiangellaceae bacterium]